MKRMILAAVAVLGIVLAAQPASALPPWGTITGTVKTMDGRGLRGVCLSAWSRNVFSYYAVDASDVTAGDGSFSLMALTPGYQRVEFRPCEWPASFFLGEWHRDARSLETSEPILVLPGETVQIDASLLRGGVIRGKVTDTSGDPLESVCVIAHEITDEDEGREYWQATYTDGRYRIVALEPGIYTVRFGARPEREDDGVCSLAYVPEFWDDTDGSNAIRLTIAAGDVVRGISASLERNEGIRGDNP